MVPGKSELAVYEGDAGNAVMDAWLQGETVWFTQSLIAELFQTSVPHISMHIRNTYKEGELQPEATIKKYLTVRQKGDREVCRRWFIMIWILQVNGQLDEMRSDNKFLAALTLLIAASAPDQKDLLIRLVVNLLVEG